MGRQNTDAPNEKMKVNQRESVRANGVKVQSVAAMTTCTSRSIVQCVSESDRPHARADDPEIRYRLEQGAF